MPVYEITDARGRTLEIEGGHEPSAAELENIFAGAFAADDLPPLEPVQARGKEWARVPEPGAAAPAMSARDVPSPLTLGQPPSDLERLEARAATPDEQALSAKLEKPLVDLPQALYEAPVLRWLAPEMAEGIAQGEKRLVEGMTSPSGLATLPYVAAGGVEAAALKGASVVGRLVAGAFGVQGAAQLPEAGKRYVKAVEAGDQREAAAAWVDLAANSLMAVGGVESVRGLKRALETPPVLDPAPATAQASAIAAQELVPESRRLMAPRTRMPEFTESTLEPGGPPAKALPAPGEATGDVLLPGSPLGERTAGYRIDLPVELDTAKAARRVWAKPIDVEAQVAGAEALRQIVSLTDEVKEAGQPYQPPTISTDLRQLERLMQRNTVSKVESWADEVIAQKMRDTSSNPFLDPELLAAAATKGAILFKRGVTKAAEWNAAMREQFGRGLEDRLPQIYEQSRDYWEGKKKGPPSELKGTSNARKNYQATAVHGDVRAQPGEGAGKVPLEAGGEGVRAQAKGAKAPVAPPPVSDQALGAVASPRLAKFLDALVPREQGTPPPLALDTATNFPDFSPIATANANFARAFGVGRVPVLGWLFDPNARIRLPFQESLGRYFSERFDVARAEASAVGEMIRGRIDKAFEVDSAGRLVGVEGPAGKDPFWVDAFEAEEARPGAYGFSPEQRAALQVWLDLKAEASPLLEKYNLSRLMDDEIGDFDSLSALSRESAKREASPYAPRIVRERPAKTARVGSGAGVGAKASFEKSRLFPTMAEGYEKGVRYEPSPEASIAVWAERVYRRIADKRLADDPGIGAKDVSAVRAELASYGADRVASGEWTPERLKQVTESVIAQGRVNQPAFAGKFVDPEVAAALNKAFPQGQHFLWREMATVTGLLKGLKFGFDWGAPMIQGVPTFLKALTSPRDAKAWARGVAGMVRAQFSAEALPAYVKNNIEPIRELAAYGSSVGRLNEMVSGLGKGAPMTKAIEAAGKRLSEAGKPLVGKPIEWSGQALEAFARSFEAFLDVTKVELWKAYREITPREQWGDTIRGIESQLLTSRIEGIGIHRGQALAERVSLIAASYVRGYVNLVGGALTQPGVSGSIMRRSMGALLISAPVLFYGVGRALGMRNDEIVERLRPDSTEYMSWRVPLPGGRNLNVGIGGIHKSFMRLAGNVYKQLQEDPKMFHLPFARWYQGHAGPLPSIAWNALTGRDFMGEPVTLPQVAARAAAPMAVETLASTTRKGQEAVTYADAAFGIFGLSSFPQSLGRQFVEERETLARKEHGKAYEKLPVADQFRLNAELRTKALFEERALPTQSQKEAQGRKELLRQRAVLAQLPAAMRERLDVLGVVLPPYDPSLRAGRLAMNFTKVQESAYQNLVVEEYTKELPKVLENEQLARATPAQRQELVGFVAARLRERAKLRLLQAINLEAAK